MYDASGRFSFQMGFPCKSGVAGSLLIVVPGVCGICTFSPRVDATGNSVRGLEFCRLLSRRYKLHCFADLNGLHESGTYADKIDPRRDDTQTNYAEDLMECIWAASFGDVNRARMMLARAVDVNGQDYDGRSALHVAAANGHIDMVGFLLGAGADTSLQDRFGNTPRMEAITNGHDLVNKMIMQVENTEAAQAQQYKRNGEVAPSAVVAAEVSTELPQIRRILRTSC